MEPKIWKRSHKDQRVWQSLELWLGSSLCWLVVVLIIQLAIEFAGYLLGKLVVYHVAL